MIDINRADLTLGIVGTGAMGRGIAQKAAQAGATGAIVPFFILDWNENVTGFAAFGLALGGLVVGSLLGRRRSLAEARDR